MQWIFWEQKFCIGFMSQEKQKCTSYFQAWSEMIAWLLKNIEQNAVCFYLMRRSSYEPSKFRLRSDRLSMSVFLYLFVMLIARSTYNSLGNSCLLWTSQRPGYHFWSKCAPLTLVGLGFCDIFRLEGDATPYYLCYLWTYRSSNMEKFA